jgi:hypothetical protein
MHHGWRQITRSLTLAASHRSVGSLLMHLVHALRVRCCRETQPEQVGGLNEITQLVRFNCLPWRAQFWDRTFLAPAEFGAISKHD